jgi:hypothetical protein
VGMGLVFLVCGGMATLRDTDAAAGWFRNC